ncbi:M56 family metallopeptidase [Psychroserpens algicola]|uniref:M56 family metallopeptidase n=1 Tax=Psychroserpens algicola TaxID=1719034 RepID=UPI00195402D9|nr:M56 family metallopeptidase [Psychroserpens algicola]
MDYLLKSSAVIVIFYLCYQLFLQRDTFFQANRWFFISGLLFAFIIPAIVIPNYIEYTPITSNFEYSYNTENLLLTPTIDEAEPFNYLKLAVWLYFAGILFFSGKLILEFLSLRKVLKKSKTTLESPYKLMETTEPVSPFSFFNRIVYNPAQFQKQELTHIINHEKVHIREWHSIDILIVQLSCVLFWFNPFIWLYKKALQQNLEFIADQKAQHISKCGKSYQTVLLKASVKNHQLAFTNQFYTSLIKKRIVMLHKSKSNKLHQLKFIIVLPVIALFMMSFSIKEIYIESPSETSKTTETSTSEKGITEVTITKDTTDDELKAIQEQLADEGITFTYKNVKRNSDGQITSIKTDFKGDGQSANYNINGDKGIEAFHFKRDGETFSVGSIKKHKNTFTYETKDGSTKVQGTGANVYVFEEDDEEEDIKSDNNKKEDKIVIYKNAPKTKVITKSSSDSNIFITASEEPLFVVDGKVVKKSLFEDIDSDEIQSIDVLKGKTALEYFGDKGKNGVIVMTKKGSNSLFMNNDGDSEVEFRYRNKDAKQPLIIINGKEASEKQLRTLDSNYIMSVEVLKDDNAVKAYGEKGQNGVIVINSKAGDKSKIFTSKNKPILVEREDNSPWTVEVSEIEYIDDDEDIKVIEFVLTKDASDAFLDRQKNALKTHGIDAKFSKIRRNKAGEITSIKITLDDNQGRKSSSSWKEKEKAIPNIVMGKSNNDKLFIRAIGH